MNWQSFTSGLSLGLSLTGLALFVLSVVRNRRLRGELEDDLRECEQRVMQLVSTLGEVYTTTEEEATSMRIEAGMLSIAQKVEFGR